MLLLLFLLLLLLLLLPEEAATAGGVPTDAGTAVVGLPPVPPPFRGDFLSPVPSVSGVGVGPPTGVDSLRLSSLIVSAGGSSEATAPLLSCSGFPVAAVAGDVRSSVTAVTAAAGPARSVWGGTLPLIRLELSSGWCWDEGAADTGTLGLASAGGCAEADCCGESCCR